MRKLLVVDDSDLSRDLFELRLKRRGFAIVLGSNGKEAVRLARSESPAAILLDVKLPDVSGVEAARIIRADPATASIPIIAISASVDEEDRAVFTGIHEKGQDFEALLTMLRELWAPDNI